ncbi:hypothetical protein GCM10022198_23970 [Klugiella xanthotipulae]|uniref:WXG100 family type VII secretion target n=1 Tax=Klugiella xanthotipulae TaxID=244735 RepID=A0A543I6B7_9MICO|nr:WXG100 family type VII secretion target [Klugiella xanthotipulae]TQM66156.1 WXG100 family type VII secretion target [Klugiella xanthotipulae]
MPNLNVSYQELDSAATRLTTGRDDIVARLTALQQEIGALVSSGFVTDRASGAYRAAYDTFTSGARTTVEGLDGLAQFLRGTASSLEELDAQLAARLAH